MSPGNGSQYYGRPGGGFPNSAAQRIPTRMDMNIGDIAKTAIRATQRSAIPGGIRANQIANEVLNAQPWQTRVSRPR